MRFRFFFAGKRILVSKDRVASSAMWFGELFQVGVYKRSQGRITRQVTFAMLAITIALASWRLHATVNMWLENWQAYALAGALLAIGLWVSYRVVNMPRFADFLIAVEAEMNKVSWPSRGELFRSSLVVIVVIFVLSTVLFGFDLTWGYLFELMGILKKAK